LSYPHRARQREATAFISPPAPETGESEEHRRRSQIPAREKPTAARNGCASILVPEHPGCWSWMTERWTKACCPWQLAAAREQLWWRPSTAAEEVGKRALRGRRVAVEVRRYSTGTGKVWRSWSGGGHGALLGWRWRHGNGVLRWPRSTAARRGRRWCDGAAGRGGGGAVPHLARDRCSSENGRRGHERMSSLMADALARCRREGERVGMWRVSQRSGGASAAA
jgi:hypothetical protein